MPIQLFNTRTKQKEVFAPITGNTVRMYHCGPTVYDEVHIGNLRSYLFADTLRRTLEWNGYTTEQVINITDIGHLSSDADTGEDKMLRGLNRENLPISQDGLKALADTYSNRFAENLKDLNILPPHILPRASEHIKEQIKLIQQLEKKGFVYTTADGVYFDTTKDSHYGVLGGIGDSSEAQARTPEREKRSPHDFALWRFDDVLGWESPWGTGVPGWHIECSAMSMNYLGESFDIHTGGIDHIPIHHNNEIAQSENVTGKPLARFWMHNAFVTLSGDKMAKSEGSGITLATLKEKGFTPLAYRYLILSAHYRSPINFTWEALENARNALTRLKNKVREDGQHIKEQNNPSENLLKPFTAHINNDLDMPGCLAYIWEIARNQDLSPEERYRTIVACDRVLGLSLTDEEQINVPEEVRKLAAQREEARQQGDWGTADILRKTIEEHGFVVEDTPTGPRITLST